jgi:transposase-like protein
MPSRAIASVTTPTVCPACQSAAIATTTRNPDENAYWRCSGCGEIWNAARRAASSGDARWR